MYINGVQYHLFVVEPQLVAGISLGTNAASSLSMAISRASSL